MSEITKTMTAVGLLAAGFYSASLFGSPDVHDTAAGSERSPERLEPLDIPAAIPPSASATWDDEVALAAHVDTGVASDRSPHKVARPSWHEHQLAFDADVTAIPEIRRSPRSSSDQASHRENAWPKDGASSDDRWASLSPPPLLRGESASPMRPSRFPERPVDAGRSVTNFPTPPETTSTTTTERFGVPSLGGSKAWGAPAVSSKQPSMPATVRSEAIWHVVTDGDSLPKLAERYLRDARRAREIYDLNRDVLTSPDLLPIGAEIRIPQEVAGPSAFEVFDGSGDRSATYKPQSRLVPLPELPASVRAVPRARLQAPVSASLVGND